ncbi:hypothetical protein [Streptomyces anulatus]|uniref:hypothetical protein n=1 Tax=Streptomyces anulatus TaxID=1892 RepID=UPI0036AAD6C1
MTSEQVITFPTGSSAELAALSSSLHYWCPRFTIEPRAQTEILDRLLELNQARLKEEQAAGPHAPGAKKMAAPKRKAKPNMESKPEDGVKDGFFPEGEKLIAAALRELEAIGYLQRAHTRLLDGRIVTRTVFCNQPAALLRHLKAAPHQPATPQAPAPAPTPQPVPALPLPLPPQPVPELEPTLQPVQVLAAAPQPVHVPAPTPEPVPPLAATLSCAPAPPPQQSAAPLFVPLVPPPTAPKPPPRPLPQPCEPTPELHRAATALLADLRRHTPEFTLFEDDIQQLAPAVAAWLECEAHPDAIRRTLTNDPPQPLRHPAKLFRHRLTSLLPPPLPGARDLAVPVRRVTITPFQTCDGCERAFRSPTPGRCRDCRTDHAQAAA